MAKRGISIERISEYLDIHRNSVSNKMNRNSSFSIEEAQAIWEKFFPDMEMKYLFLREDTTAEEKGE